MVLGTLLTCPICKWVLVTLDDLLVYSQIGHFLQAVSHTVHNYATCSVSTTRQLQMFNFMQLLHALYTTKSMCICTVIAHVHSLHWCFFLETICAT